MPLLIELKPVRLSDFSEYVEVLAAIHDDDLDIVLVGGHAVSVYARKYHDQCPQLDSFFPFLSKDADWLGTIDLGMRLAAKLSAEWKKNPTKGGMRGLSLGSISLPNHPDVRIEILGQILGPTTDEIRKTAYVEAYDNFRFKIINPFLLYEAKAHNLVQIPQVRESGNRQDGKQFQIMGLVLEQTLRELSELPGSERALVKASNRLINFWLQPVGTVLIRAGISTPQQILPLEAMRSHSSESIRNLANIGFQHFQSELQRKLPQISEETLMRLQMEARAGKR